MSGGKVRAVVWSTGKFTPRRRLRRGQKHRSNGLTWHYKVVRPDGATILYDNTGDYDIILRAALIRVEALRHMSIAGHSLPEYRS